MLLNNEQYFQIGDFINLKKKKIILRLYIYFRFHKTVFGIFAYLLMLL